MTFDVSLGVPAIAAATGAQSVFDTVINSVIDNGPIIAGRLVGGCYMVLTVCVGIRLCKALMEAVYDDSIVSGVADAIQVVVTGLILLMGLTHIPEIAGVVWAVVDETMGVMDLSGSSSGAKSIATNLMNNTWSIIPEIFNAFFEAPPEPEKDKGYFEKAVDTLATALNFTTLMHVSMGLLCVVMALIYAIIISVQIAVGLMQISIGIAFLPVTLAFYPIIENWAKNAVGTIAAGIAHMGICAFLISMVSKTASDLTDQVVNGGFTAFGSAIPYEAANKAIAFLALGAFLLVLGLSTGKAVGFATGIFGSVGGMIGRTAARGGSPASSAANAGGKAASAAGKTAMDAGAKAGAAGAAKGGAAVAGAASGAATAGVGTAATAAVGAGTKAMEAGGKAAMGAATGAGSAAGAAGLDAAGKTSSGLAGTGVGATGTAGTGAGGPKASFGEKAGMAAALVGAAAKNAGGKVGTAGMAAARKAAASPAGMAVRKGGAAVGGYAGKAAGNAAKMAKSAPKALMRAQMRSTING